MTIRKHQDYFLLKFKEINNINEIILLKGQDITSLINYDNNNLVFIPSLKNFSISYDKQNFTITDINTTTNPYQLFCNDVLFLFNDKFIKNINYSKQIIYLKKIIKIK